MRVNDIMPYVVIDYNYVKYYLITFSQDYITKTKSPSSFPSSPSDQCVDDSNNRLSYTEDGTSSEITPLRFASSQYTLTPSPITDGIGSEDVKPRVVASENVSPLSLTKYGICSENTKFRVATSQDALESSSIEESSSTSTRLEVTSAQCAPVCVVRAAHHPSSHSPIFQGCAHPRSPPPPPSSPPHSIAVIPHTIVVSGYYAACLRWHLSLDIQVDDLLNLANCNLKAVDAELRRVSRRCSMG